MVTTIGDDRIPRGYLDNHFFPNASRLSGNYFEDDADKSKLLSGFVPEGWNTSLGKPKAIVLTDEQADDCFARRLAEYETVKASDEKLEYRSSDGSKFNIPAAMRLRAWELTFCNEDGSIIAPTHASILCRRRLSLWPDVVAVCLMKDIEAPFEIPIEIVQGSELDLYSANLQENILKTMGSKSISEKDLLLAAELVYKVGATTEADIERAFGKGSKGARGKAQWAFWFWQCDTAFPEFRLGDKLRSNAISPPRIGGKEKMRTMAKEGANTDELVDFFEKGKKEKKIRSTTTSAMGEFCDRHKANKMACRHVGAVRINELGRVTKNADGELLKPWEIALLNGTEEIVYNKGAMRDAYIAEHQDLINPPKANEATA